MMTSILSLVVAGNIMLPTKAHAAPGACNCVIFRLDDIQDEWITHVQTAIIDKFIERNENLDLPIIMNSIGNDPVIVNKVKEGIATGLIETSLHGWNHIDYRTLSLQQQQKTLEMANQKMEELFGSKTSIFVAPYNAYNEDTLKAINQAGLKILSSEFDQEIESIYDPDNPDSPDNKVYKAIAGGSDTIIKDQFGVYHLPQVIGFYTYDSDPPTKTPLSKIESQIDSAIASYGYAVVTLHPQDFTVKDAGNNPTEELSQDEMKDLDTLLTWINDQNYHTGTFSGAVSNNNSQTSSAPATGSDDDNNDNNNDDAATVDLVAPLINTIISSLRPSLGGA
ncbi:putative xylanase/chitin deacetylase [Candidatus Nitrososphaera evergladensis SR1]|jgi:peptidoglycan/xylan/chitin deacetylase (PgdA/CDA1 family)|uniref:Putative xylanase/chitin deacetylase n=1 Tax=Candidatus Nitrososphaera evergladensis SR1 TaxID=1459636 RepID=A0A075MRV0_9ARCH|nr:polysaccharide deacetylase family protein [Candidatus Nitrososphaera evergladensis]AIF83547.1 putative xylanase/chitin deacetylase [Candidatus Nitrososphaera evergladensis SR1]